MGNPVSALSRRERWPLVGVAAGLFGILGTLVTDIHVEGDGTRGDVVTMADVGKIDQQLAHFSIVSGFIAVTLLLALAALWRKTVEPLAPASVAARIVTQALTGAAGALSLGYGWKGASAIYHADGMDADTYDEMGLYVYYILNDFGSYIGWFGVTVAAGAVAWMSLKERVLPLWIGIWSLVPVLAVIGFTGGTGLPGFPGVVSPIWMVVTFAGLALTRLAPAAVSDRGWDSTTATAAAD
jgi:hypothetical protein